MSTQQIKVIIWNVYIVLFVIISARLPAQERQFFFDLVGIQNGLPGGEINDIKQDFTGFLWVATAKGLVLSLIHI